MKITQKNSDPKELYPKDLEPGTIFEVNGFMALKLMSGNEVLLLTHNDGTDWFDLADGSETTKVTEVYGKLVELVVE